eukprot:scaffold1089_cov131-Skeletonema_menzelii.AAC.6
MILWRLMESGGWYVSLISTIKDTEQRWQHGRMGGNLSSNLISRRVTKDSTVALSIGGNKDLFF